MNLRFHLLLPALALVLLCADGCVPRRAPVPPPADLVRLAPGKILALVDDMAFDGLVRAVDQSLIYLRRVPPGQHFRFGTDSYDRDHLVRSLERFCHLIETQADPASLARAVHSEFLIYRATGRNAQGDVLFTGYYEPTLRGCRHPNAGCRYPVYGRPTDLLSVDLSPFGERFSGQRIIGRVAGQTMVPYPDRRAIDMQNALAGKAPVLAWVNDPVDLFFLQIQGSGRIALAEGGILRLHYAVSNGRPYRSIGRLLVDSGEIAAEAMSMQAIRGYLSANPQRQAEVLGHNPSYVFFEISETGPLGSLSVPLTPGRSLATDPQHFPKGALAFIRCVKPLTDDSIKIVKWAPFGRFVLNQDTGGAIRGPGRADLFWGEGPYAELAAGHLQHSGALYFLVLKPEKS